jgi:hypothetical protein
MLALDDKTRQKVDSGIRALEREFEGRVGHETVEAIGWETLDELLADARVPDFVPVLVRRFTHERLLEMAEKSRQLAA